MSLDGLRAWIGEVERKLGMRTRVFLVLAVIAIGGAGAAIYLAIDTRENAVSESDVQALQEKLEARIDAGVAAAASEPTPAPEHEPVSPESKPAQPETGGASAEPETEARGEPAQHEAGGGGADNSGGSSKGGKPPTLAERLQQTREANAKAEQEARENK